MIAKIVHRASAADVLAYITREDHKPTFLYGVGVLLDNINTIARSFERQASMHPGISKPYVHVAISFAPEDSPKVTKETMIEILHRYAQLMKLDDSQVVAYEHHDHEGHLHFHALFNRIDSKGNVTSDKNERKRNVDACKRITTEFGLYMPSRRRKEVDISKLYGKEKMKAELALKVKTALERSISWKDFENELKAMGITMYFRYAKQSKVVKGIVFSTHKISFGGSKLDPMLSFRNLDKALGGLTPSRSYIDTSHDIEREEGETYGQAASWKRLWDFDRREEPEETDNAENVLEDAVQEAENISIVLLDGFMSYLTTPLKPSITVGGGGGGGSKSPWNDRKREEEEYQPRTRRGRR